MSKTFTDIKNVYAGAMASGIKEDGLDLTYVYIPTCSSSAGVFTKNSFSADCVSLTKKHLATSPLKALIINSGNANAVTPGAKAANQKILEATAAKLGIKEGEVAIASTGIIGQDLPVDKIISGLDQLLTDPEKQDGESSAEAILTTDTCSKICFYEKTIAGKTVQISGMAKGAGMIAPNMATMLSFMFTNVKVPAGLFQDMLSEITEETYNMVSVDTDTSTNDMVLAFSTGDVELDFDSEEVLVEYWQLFYQANLDLAKRIVSDGEGARRLIEAQVHNAATKDEARLIAKNIINSPLVKTALSAADPNWGRIVMAIGKADHVLVDPNKVNVELQGVQVVQSGLAHEFDRDALREKLDSPEVTINIDLDNGHESASAWGCDLNHEYININLAYN